jgi:16S rRNA (adenine1518-N6/adenine1519-N6)-dimethyltransferase
LKRKDFRPKKRFGQNFLYDPAIAGRIVEAAGIEPGQTVIELGAGKGILTEPMLARGARIIALELDRALCQVLQDRFMATPEPDLEPKPAVEILNVDFTKISLTGLLAARGLDRCKLIGNIPYHLTRDVLFSFLVDELEVVDSAFIMLQKEVGDRIVAGPGSRVYGITSVILQSLYTVRTVLKVAPGSFHPQPKVASLVLGFEPLKQPLVSAQELKHFVKFVKNIFQQRRKTVHNTMKASYELSEAALKEIRSVTEVDLQCRPEALDNQTILRLSRSLVEVTKV